MSMPANPPGPPADAGAATIPSPDIYWISLQIGAASESILDAERLHRLAIFVLEAEGRRDALELGITVTDDEEIHALNQQYLGHDEPTDVLSFAGASDPSAGAPDDGASEGAEQDTVPASDYVTEGYEGDEEESGATQPLPDRAEPAGPAPSGSVAFVTPPGWPTYLGDVVISYDTAAAQAGDYGHSSADEVEVLLVHGLLHLLGYDDHDPAERARMHARQDALVAAFARGA